MLCATALCLFLCLIYVLWKRFTNVWVRRGVKQIKPGFLGNVGPSLLLRRCEAELYDGFYRESNGEPAVGFYKIWEPTLLVRSPILMKQILITDFNSFSDNDIYWHPTDIVLAIHPFTTKQHVWKQSRSLTSPLVIPSKIKSKVVSIVDVCKNMVRYLERNQNVSMEAKTLGGHFTTGTSARTIYNAAENAFEDPDSDFRRYNALAFDTDWLGLVQYTLATYFPKFSRFFKIGLTPRQSEDFYLNLVSGTYEYRTANQLQGNDFLQHLMDKNPEMGVHDLTGHTMGMLWDVYSTSSIVISHCLDLLSSNPHVQDRLRNEIDEYVHTLDDLTYDRLETMPYLSAFMSEVLRLRTPLPVLRKVCTKDIVLEEDGKIYPLYRGDRLILPIWSLHNDPVHFDNVDQFVPERFIENSEQPAYLPFSLGPRKCSGMKFGLTQTKACILSIVKYFRIIPAKDTYQDQIIKKRLSLDTKSTLFLQIDGGIWIKFESIPNKFIPGCE